MTRKQAVNHIRRDRGVTDRREFRVRSRVVAGERRIEIHRVSQASFVSRGSGKAYKHRVSNGQVLVFASRRSWTHAAAQSGEVR